MVLLFSKYFENTDSDYRNTFVIWTKSNILLDKVVVKVSKPQISMSTGVYLIEFSL